MFSFIPGCFSDALRDYPVTATKNAINLPLVEQSPSVAIKVPNALHRLAGLKLQLPLALKHHPTFTSQGPSCSPS